MGWLYYLYLYLYLYLYIDIDLDIWNSGEWWSRPDMLIWACEVKTIVESIQLGKMYWVADEEYDNGIMKNNKC